MPPHFFSEPHSLSPSYRRARAALRHVPTRLLLGERNFHRGDRAATVLYVAVIGNNAESSRNAATILEHVHRVAPLQAVLVETLSGTVDLSHLRRMTRSQLTRHVEEGKLLGPIYFAAVHDVDLYGVENAGLFQQAQQAQRGAAQSQVAVAPYLESLRAAVAQVTPQPAPESCPFPLAWPKRWSGLLKKLLTLQLTYEDWLVVQTWLPEYGPGDFEAALAAGMTPGTIPPAALSTGLREATKHACLFYETAVMRGRTLADNTRRYLDQTGATWVAGCWTGFQAAAFLETIREQGFSYLHLTANLTAEKLGSGSVNLFETELDEILGTDGNSGNDGSLRQATALLRQALQFAERRQHQEALTALRETSRLASGDLPAARQLRFAAATHIAVIQNSRGHFRESCDSLEEVETHYPEFLDTSFYLLLAEAAAACQRHPRAAQAMTAAMSLLDKSSSDQAIRQRSRAVNIYCELEDFHSYLAQCEWLVQHFESIGNLDLAGLFQNNLGLAALKLGQVEEARTALDRSVAHARAASPPEELAITLVNRARALITGGELQRAQADLEEADRLLPEADPRQYRRLRVWAHLFHARGEVAEALRLARQVVQMPKVGVNALNREDDETWIRTLEARLE